MNEGVDLFASFVMLLNFQRYGKMKGMGKVVEWSIRDESIHVEGIARLFKITVQNILVLLMMSSRQLSMRWQDRQSN